MLLGDGASLVPHMVEDVLPTGLLATLGEELLAVLERDRDVTAYLGDLLGVGGLELGDVLVVRDEALCDGLELDWRPEVVSPSSGQPPAELGRHRGRAHGTGQRGCRSP